MLIYKIRDELIDLYREKSDKWILFRLVTKQLHSKPFHNTYSL